VDTRPSEEKIKEVVRETYGGIAQRFNEGPVRNHGSDASPGEAEGPARMSCCEPRQVASSGCCAPKTAEVSCCEPSRVEGTETSAAARFYSAEELAGLPESVTEISLGCGNPTAIAELQPGDVVLDLGAGGGIDCFLAASRVGPQGRVIGLDMTPDMIKLARRNAKKIGATNVEFRYGEMEEIPLPDESVNVIISNCVINLSPDKDAVFREANRVLQPGGRISISDIVVDGELPQPIRDSLNAWAGCIAGALDEDDYLDKIRAAGFEAVSVQSREFISVDSDAEWEEMQAILEGTGLSARDIGRRVASIKVRAYKSDGGKND
jgi:SAM-dependent methyltransferase